MYIKKVLASMAALAVSVTAATVTAFAVDAASPEEDFIISDGIITGYTGKGGDIVIPEGVTQIGWYAFSENDNITNVVIPKGCTQIDNAAFSKCSALKSVIFEGDIKMGTITFLCCTSLENVTFKGNFIDLSRDSAFWGCQNLKTVEFAPNSCISVIGKGTFKNCAKLSEVKLPNEVGKICELAFSNCPELTRLEIPSMTELEDFSVGYMQNEDDTLKFEQVKADGSATVQTRMNFLNDEEILEEIRQKPITLIVAPNSPAEKYAQENGIAYEYKTEDGSTESPETGGAGMQTLLAAMALSLTVMIFTSVKRT